MRRIICAFVLISLIFRGFSIENHKAGARPVALSDAYVSVSDIWSTFHNQAGIAGMDQISAGLFYESRFFLKELSTAAGVVLIPTSTGNFAFSFNQFGRKTTRRRN